MRDAVKEIIQDAWLMADFIQKARDIPEAKGLIAGARQGLVDLAIELAELPSDDEEEPIPVHDLKFEPEPAPEPKTDSLRKI